MAEANGARRALVIGVGNYDESQELPALQTPTSDVSGFARVLRDRQRCRFNDVRELVDPNSQQLRESVESLFTSAQRNDLVLLYFSGHGKLNTRGGLHLCATNTRERTLVSTSLPVTDIRQFIDSTAIGQVVLVFDCCFSGAAEQGLKGDLPSLVTNDLGEGQGKYVMTSSSAIQVSRGRPGDTYSLFTKWLIEGLESGSPDGDQDGVITIEELYRYARDRTTADEPAQQPKNFTFEIKPGNVVIGYTARPARRSEAVTLASTNPVFFNAVDALLAEGRVIPFLGAGIFGNGPLSPFRIATALAERAGLAGQPDVATAAEYLQQLLEDREMFLREFRTILTRQSSELERNATYDFVLAVRRPPLILSATYDMLLEQHLEKEHVPYTLVSHVVNSRDGEHDGKIMVVRKGAGASTAELCRADQLVLPAGEELVIYKVLGSPFLGELADPAADIDTVVITESDHLTFVGRLENEHTRVPDAFSIPFQRSWLLFLGYSLDLWNYRMVLRVFGQGRSRLKKKSYAVRQPTTQMEQLYWQRLPSDMIEADPEQFAAQVVRGLTLGAAV
jgi:caspase domain-containing protein/SIR2-like protein